MRRKKAITIKLVKNSMAKLILFCLGVVGPLKYNDILLIFGNAETAKSSLHKLKKAKYITYDNNTHKKIATITKSGVNAYNDKSEIKMKFKEPSKHRNVLEKQAKETSQKIIIALIRQDEHFLNVISTKSFKHTDKNHSDVNNQSFFASRAFCALFDCNNYIKEQGETIFLSNLVVIYDLEDKNTKLNISAETSLFQHLKEFLIVKNNLSASILSNLRIVCVFLTNNEDTLLNVMNYEHNTLKRTGHRERGTYTQFSNQSLMIIPKSIGFNDMMQAIYHYNDIILNKIKGENYEDMNAARLFDWRLGSILELFRCMKDRKNSGQYERVYIRKNQIPLIEKLIKKTKCEEKHLPEFVQID